MPTPQPQFAFFCNLPQYVRDPYKRFLENRSKGLQIERGKGRVILSKIFDWFEDDFAAEAGSVQRYLAEYVDDEQVRDALKADPLAVFQAATQAAASSSVASARSSSSILPPGKTHMPPKVILLFFFSISTSQPSSVGRSRNRMTVAAGIGGCTPASSSLRASMFPYISFLC